MIEYLKLVKKEWLQAWQQKSYRQALLIGIALIVLVVPVLPHFYGYIERRPGVVLNDWILAYLIPRNVSIPVFIIIWSGVLLVSFRASIRPRIFLNYLYAYLFFIIIRSLCLLLVPLEAPIGIIELKDPLTDIFYGGSFITKDLFFSGHTSTLVIMFLSLQKRIDKAFCLLAIVAVAFMLLVQHVHYTIDVLAAPFFASLCYWLGQKTINSIGKVKE